MTVVVGEFRYDSVGEAVDGMLCPAVRRLQGDATMSEGGSHLDDVAGPARCHPIQGGACAVHHSEVGNPGSTVEIVDGRIQEF